MKKYFGLSLALMSLAALAGCNSDANVVSQNISTAADNFEINRHIVFYNGITGEYMLEMTGLCSLGNFDTSLRMTVTCKTGPSQYKKNYLGLSDNVTFFSEQIDTVAANPYQYRVIWKPLSLIPNIQVK